MVITLLLQVMVTLGHVHLAADDGLDRRVLLGVLEKLLDAVEVAMVGHGQSRHPQLFRPVEKVFYGCLSIQNRILGMDVEMYEVHIANITILPRTPKKIFHKLALTPNNSR